MNVLGGIEISRKVLVAVVCTLALVFGAMGCLSVPEDPTLPPPTPQQQAERVINRIDGVITLVDSTLRIVAEREGGDPEKFADAVFYAKLTITFIRGTLEMALADLDPFVRAGIADASRVKELTGDLEGINTRAAGLGIDPLPTPDNPQDALATTP